jgi:uroporphyrin-III C-methyltransferase/precorrin-2 dehydrogenase/sirohydrochlorin ferrochelatase
MDYFPVFLDGSKIRSLVVGGGEVAARKLELLLKTQAEITLVAAQINDNVQRLVKTHAINWLQKNFHSGLMKQVNLVIAATDDPQVNQQVHLEATSLNLLVNVVDAPQLCSYITPAIIDRDPMLIALSSSGKSPVLIRMLRESIEKNLPQDYGLLAEFSGKNRDLVKRHIKGIANRRLFWEKLLSSTLGDALLNKNEVLAQQILEQALDSEQQVTKCKLTIVHVGDGNPDNLTLAAHREMQTADAVIYTKTLNPDLIEYIRRDAEKYPEDNRAEVGNRARTLDKVSGHIICLLAGQQTYSSEELNWAGQYYVKQLISGCQ